MKKLYIIRHTQKDENSSPEDYFIKLTPQGLDDAVALANLLETKDINPDLIVSSPALRARKTAKIISKTLGFEKNIMYNEVMYQGYLEEVIEAITFTFHTVETLIIVGHNPLLSNLASHLVGYKNHLDMGTCVAIEFDTSTRVDIGAHNAKLLEVIKA